MKVATFNLAAICQGLNYLDASPDEAERMMANLELSRGLFVDWDSTFAHRRNNHALDGWTGFVTRDGIIAHDGFRWRCQEN